MQRIIIIAGIVIIVIGILWPWLIKLPFGRLPGDIMINKPHVKIFFPITTMVILSVLVSLILYLYRKF